ncbi:hypothetical protein ACFQ3P_32705 [Paraburkholderia sabiae]|uniref:DRBM domain-containing protein n=1 Tax=Paraburkholderia sabiae TaxID=273251 RepID=A0ABU9QJ36_9BURK|nr:hypothetical protein [Paraburkholderia sabiae]WJZ80021.1 hypothetical protein QEN71_43530 [Paraburkholderia sabiae]CAD6559494.1 hypothetical protein LMG24235_06691 [Paraburkholderia sabiae]
MTTQTITDDFDIMWSVPERAGKGFACRVVVVNRKTNDVAGTYSGEAATAREAENIACNKAKQAIYDGFSLDTPRLASAPAQAQALEDARASEPAGKRLDVVVKNVDSVASDE